MSSRPRRQPVSSDRRFRKKSEAADYGPAERWQHSGRILEVTEHAGVLAARVSEEHIIDIMVARNLVSEAQREAALKFKLDYQRAALAAHVTASYSAVRSSQDPFRGERERNDFEEAAYRRWRHAVRELGMLLSGIVISTVCHDLLPTPKDMPALQRGLTVLTDWYKIPKSEV
jgi:hypothetical protein